MKKISGQLGGVWGPFVMVFIEADKQTMGSGSTSYKHLSSGGLSRLLKNRVFGGGGGGGGTPKITIFDPPQKCQKKLWGPIFLTFF